MKKRLAFYFILFTVCSVAAIFTTSNYSGFTIYILLGWIIIMIPTIFSFIPLVEDTIKKSTVEKISLSDSTFTDRKGDIKEIICALKSNKSIQLLGSESGCGKSWLVKKICDLINNKSHLRKYIGEEIHTRLKKAIYVTYIKNENQLYDIFSSNKITKTTLLVFDDIPKNLIKLIKSHQDKSNFKFIYILNEPEIYDVCTYSVGKFREEHLSLLHDKIIKIYPLVSRLSEAELKIVHSLTDGNIFKISEILSRAEYVNWVKTIALKKTVEYVLELNKIEVTLFVGKYLDAKNELKYFKEKYDSSLNINNDLFFRYTIIKSDCEHLLNNYSVAYDIIKTLNVSDERNENFAVERLTAHYLKHLWKPTEALAILNNISSYYQPTILDTFGIYLADLFISSRIDNNSLNKFIEKFLQIDDIDNSKFKRYAIYYEFYNNNDFYKLIAMADELIEIYKKENNRLLANAFVLRGEIYRLFKKYDLAFKDYEQSLTITSDKNIKTQVYLMAYYIENVNKSEINKKLNNLTKIDLVELCQNNKYSELIFSQINSILLEDDNSSIIKYNMNTRIMPIL